MYLLYFIWSNTALQRSSMTTFKFFVMSISFEHSTPYIRVVFRRKNKGCNKKYYNLCSLYSVTVCPSLCRYPALWYAVGVNKQMDYPLSIPALVWYQQPIQTNTYSVMFIAASCTEGIPMDYYFFFFQSYFTLFHFYIVT